MEEEEINETWEVLKDHPDYEINCSYPYQIRKISDGRILKESVMNAGYLRVVLNNKHYLKHRLIAQQWLPNPEGLPCIDHKNHIRTDNRLENLRWVSYIENNNNLGKTWTGRKIEFVQELPDDVIVVNQYGRYHFNGYYFANDVFYKDTGNGNYRIIPWHYRQSKNYYDVALTDENTIARTISKNVFYRLYGLT